MSLRITNPKEFDLGLKKFADKLMIDMNLVIKKVAFDVYKGVNEKTPVDTGYARASWNISPHHPDPSIENAKKYPSGTKPFRRFGSMGNENLHKQRSADTSKPVTRWFITNNVPYILYLEAGHSKQSAHMVTRTLNEVRANVAAILKGIE